MLDPVLFVIRGSTKDLTALKLIGEDVLDFIHLFSYHRFQGTMSNQTGLTKTDIEQLMQRSAYICKPCNIFMDEKY